MPSSDHLVLARDHLARASRSASLGGQWDSTWRAFEQVLRHRYLRVEEGELPTLIRHWSNDLNHHSPNECRTLACSPGIDVILSTPRHVWNMTDRPGSSDNSGERAVAVLRRARVQGVPVATVCEALQLCRLIRNEIAHGLKVSTRRLDRSVMEGTLPFLREVVQAALEMEERIY